MNTATLRRPDVTGHAAHRQAALRSSNPARIVATRSATRRVGIRSRWPSRIQAGEVMTAPVGTVDQRSSVLEAALRLVEHADTQLVVMDGRRPVGIVNEQILAAQWPIGLDAAYRRSLLEVKLPEVQAVQADDDVRDVAEIMVSGNCPAVVVVSRDAVIGVVTVRNLLDLLAGRPSTTSWPDDD